MTIEASLKTINETLLRIEELLGNMKTSVVEIDTPTLAVIKNGVQSEVKPQASPLPDAPFLQEEEAAPCPLTNPTLVAKYAQQAHKSFNPNQVQQMMMVFKTLNAVNENDRPALRFLPEANYADFYKMIEAIKAGG